MRVNKEHYLRSEMDGYPFGLHGYVDYLKIDSDKKIATICDLKTTSKTIADFTETVDFYNYWLKNSIDSILSRCLFEDKLLQILTQN